MEQVIVKPKRHTLERVLKKIAEGDKMLNEGAAISEVARSSGVTETTWRRWNNGASIPKTSPDRK
jgi:DNA invertase Pin-like site-specific DNA recombinase